MQLKGGAESRVLLFGFVFVALGLAIIAALPSATATGYNNLCTTQTLEQLATLLQTVNQLDSGAFLLEETKRISICDAVICVYCSGCSGTWEDAKFVVGTIDQDPQKNQPAVNIKSFKSPTTEWQLTVGPEGSASPMGASCEKSQINTVLEGARGQAVTYEVKISKDPTAGQDTVLINFVKLL